MGRAFAGGTTDAIAINQTTRYQQRTYMIWSNLTTSPTAFHRMFQNAANGIWLDTTNTTYRFQQGWATQVGEWSVPAPSTNAWHFVGVTYDDGATTNDPAIWIDTTKNTIGSGLTEVLTPSGSLTTSHANPKIGNRPAGDRSWRGGLARFAQYSGILSDDDMLALANGAHPFSVRRELLVEHVEMLGDVISSLLAAPTVTGTTLVDHPRLLWRRKPILLSTAAPVAPPAAAFLEASNRGICRGLARGLAR